MNPSNEIQMQSNRNSEMGALIQMTTNQNATIIKDISIIYLNIWNYFSHANIFSWDCKKNEINNKISHIAYNWAKNKQKIVKDSHFLYIHKSNRTDWKYTINILILDVHLGWYEHLNERISMQDKNKSHCFNGCGGDDGL